ncbi:hypothetical protein HU200_034068 [Digitaria exilis]|uniref:Uncharacterized protein n=1 Tax=Digitaria exilis TaxID=1010633 RepID=A0A835EMW5_9POAL|nr:hypothetical protein HU200_034068 [Digitaria exilis]
MRRQSSTSTTTRLLLVAAAALGACCLAVVLALGAFTAGVEGARPRPRPPSSAVLGVGSSMVAARAEDGYAAAARRGLPGGEAEAAELDYGYVDPTPDTRSRGGTAPIPHK